ncbi:MAG: NUDIX hydrolase [Gammaproteobacteria bacterium]
MNYCSNCGNRLVLRIPAGDDRPRYVCYACHTTHYQNPKLVTGCIPQWQDQILLCRRAIEPRYGMWTLPAGFLENGETTAEAAARETLEEANARVAIDAPFSLLDIPRINQVYLMFRARLLALDYAPGSESLEVQLFRESEIPWESLAFPAVEQTLVLFFEDRRAGTFRMHNEAIWRRPGEPRP